MCGCFEKKLKSLFRRFRWCLLFLLALLGACTSTVQPMHQQSVVDMQQQLQQAAQQDRQIDRQSRSANNVIPSSVDAALLPSLNGRSPATSHDERFDVAVHNMPAKQFFLSLVKGTPYNMVVSPEIEGKITMNLKNVTVVEALDAIQNVYGYEYIQTSYGFDVMLPHLQTRIFMINHLNVTRKGSSSTSVNGSGTSTNDSSMGVNNANADAAAVTTENSSDFWANLKATITMLITTSNSKEGTPSVSINPSTGVIAVKADPVALRAVENYLKTTESIEGRQVMLEASFLEVELSKGFNAGINWSMLGASFEPNSLLDTSASESLALSNNPLLTTSYGNIFELNASSGSFEMAVQLLSKEGQVSVLSNPRVSALNNQKAVIKVGSDSYFVTSMSNTDLVNNSDTSALQSNIGLKPFFSGIALEVIPQIGKNDEVTLHIHPKISLTKTNETKVVVNGEETAFPTASSSIRETDSVVKAKNGQVIIIGGLMQTLTDMRQSKLVPLDQSETLKPLADAGGTKQDAGIKTELVILLKPIIINSGAWATELEKTSKTAFNPSKACMGPGCKKAS